MHDLLYLLDEILGPHQTHTGGEFYWMCPFCHHHKPKLAINLNKGAWHCWVCNASGKKLISLFKKIDCTKEQITQLVQLTNEDIKIPDQYVSGHLALPPEYHPLWKPLNRIDYKHAIQYLTQRGITAHDILRYQLGYCPDGTYANRIIIPSYDEHGKLNYFVGRSFYDSDGLKYKNPKVSKNIIGFEYHINWKYPIILCEGVFDAIAIKRNAIPLLGKTIPTSVLSKIIEHQVKDVYLALDNDAMKQTTRMASHLIKDGINVHIVELNDKDPSQIGFIHMNELIKNARPLSFTELIKLQVTT